MYIDKRKVVYKRNVYHAITKRCGVSYRGRESLREAVEFSRTIPQVASRRPDGDSQYSSPAHPGDCGSARHRQPPTPSSILIHRTVLTFRSCLIATRGPSCQFLQPLLSKYSGCLVRGA